VSRLIPWRGEMDRLRREMESLYDRFLDLRYLHRFGEEGEWMSAVDQSAGQQMEALRRSRFDAV
jgi:hypothetical protein